MAKKFTFSAIILYVMWLLLSGYFHNSLLLTLGACSAVLVTALGFRLGILKTGTPVLQFCIRLLGYIPWLLGQVIKSNLDVSRRVWQPVMPVNPVVVFIPCTQKTDLGLALHANSITLTPGTLSLDAGGGFIEVHALSQDIADGFVGGEMDRRVTAVEGGA